MTIRNGAVFFPGLIRIVAIGILLLGAGLAAPDQLDPALDVGSGSSGSIHAVAVDAQGRILVVGNFTQFNGSAAGCIVRLLENGSIDPAFHVGTGANFAIKAIEILPDGRILLGGQFTNFGMTSTRGLVMLLPDGTVDTTFLSQFASEGFSSGVTCVEFLPGGSLAVGGYFTKYGGTTAGRYAILDSSGALVSQTLQDPGATSHVFDIDVQSDGRILLCGFFQSINGHTSGCVARLLADGNVDSSFSTGTNLGTVVYSVAGQADGKVVVGGNFSSFFGGGQCYLGRLTVTGELDPTFVGTDGPNLNVYGVSVDSEDIIIIAGQFTEFQGEPLTGIGRLRADGSRDRSFSFAPRVSSSFIQEFPIDAQGRILAYGWPKFLSSGVSADLARIVGGDPSPAESWRLAHFGAFAVTEQSAWDAVVAHDGITNLEKYALGYQEDPRIPTTLWAGDGLLGGFWRDGFSSGFFFQTDSSRSDAAVTAEWNDDLSGWSRDQIHITEESRNGNLVTWKATLSGTHPQAFFRVKLTVEE